MNCHKCNVDIGPTAIVVRDPAGERSLCPGCALAVLLATSPKASTCGSCGSATDRGDPRIFLVLIQHDRCLDVETFGSGACAGEFLDDMTEEPDDEPIAAPSLPPRGQA